MEGFSQRAGPIQSQSHVPGSSSFLVREGGAADAISHPHPHPHRLQPPHQPNPIMIPVTFTFTLTPLHTNYVN